MGDGDGVGESGGQRKYRCQGPRVGHDTFHDPCLVSTLPHGAQCREGHSVSLTASLTSSLSTTGEPTVDGGGGESDVGALIFPASSLQGHRKEASGRAPVRDPPQVPATSPSPAFPALGLSAPHCD